MEGKLEEGIYPFKIASSESEKILAQRSECVDSGSDSLHLRLISALVTRPCASYAPSFGSGSTYIKQGQ